MPSAVGARHGIENLLSTDSKKKFTNRAERLTMRRNRTAKGHTGLGFVHFAQDQPELCQKVDSCLVSPPKNAPLAHHLSCKPPPLQIILDPVELLPQLTSAHPPSDPIPNIPDKALSVTHKPDLNMSENVRKGVHWSDSEKIDKLQKNRSGPKTHRDVKGSD